MLMQVSFWFWFRDARNQHIFKIIIYFFNTSKCAAKYVNFIWDIWWFHRSNDFEAMKAGKSAIRPWLICQYNSNSHVDLPSSMVAKQFMYIKLASNSWCVSYSFKYGRPNTIWYSIAQSFGRHWLLFRHFENKRGKNWIKLRYLAKQLANLESRPVYSLINTTYFTTREGNTWSKDPEKKGTP